MKYKIIFNIPHEPSATEVAVDLEQMDKLVPMLANKGQIVKINGCYLNSTYFVKAVPDVEANRLEDSQKYLRLEQTAQTNQDKINREAINELKKKLFNK